MARIFQINNAFSSSWMAHAETYISIRLDNSMRFTQNDLAQIFAAPLHRSYCPKKKQILLQMHMAGAYPSTLYHICISK